MNVKIEMRIVQKYKFWADCRTGTENEIEFFSFEITDDIDYIVGRFHSWVDKKAMFYPSGLKGYYTQIGEPYIQKIISVPISEIRSLFELGDSETINHIRFSKEWDKDMTITIGINEPNENSSSG